MGMIMKNVVCLILYNGIIYADLLISIPDQIGGMKILFLRFFFSYVVPSLDVKWNIFCVLKLEQHNFFI